MLAARGLGGGYRAWTRPVERTQPGRRAGGSGLGQRTARSSWPGAGLVISFIFAFTGVCLEDAARLFISRCFLPISPGCLSIAAVLRQPTVSGSQPGSTPAASVSERCTTNLVRIPPTRLTGSSCSIQTISPRKRKRQKENGRMKFPVEAEFDWLLRQGRPECQLRVICPNAWPLGSEMANFQAGRRTTLRPGVWQYWSNVLGI
jgi:hypothetical protein